MEKGIDLYQNTVVKMVGGFDDLVILGDLVIW